MERNTRTTIYNLQTGDRFYKANDRNKIVYEKIEHESKQTRWQTYKHWAIEAALLDKGLMSKAIDSFARSFKSDSPVIFLRHKGNE